MDTGFRFHCQRQAQGFVHAERIGIPDAHRKARIRDEDALLGVRSGLLSGHDDVTSRVCGGHKEVGRLRQEVISCCGEVLPCGVHRPSTQRGHAGHRLLVGFQPEALGQSPNPRCQVAGLPVEDLVLDLRNGGHLALQMFGGQPVPEVEGDVGRVVRARSFDEDVGVEQEHQRASSLLA